MHKARGHGARRVPHPQHARAARQRRPRARCAIRPPATPTARKRRSRSTSTRRSASCWCTTATSPTRSALKEELFRHRPPPHQHRAATPRCCSTCSRTSSRRPRAAAARRPTTSSPRSRAVHRRVEGSYAVVALIAGHGAARVPRPVRHPPAVFGTARRRTARESWWRSESVALDGTGFTRGARRRAGRGGVHRPRGQAPRAAVRRATRALNPCMFEYVYLARPDSVMDGVSVYQARLNMGETLAERMISTHAAAARSTSSSRSPSRAGPRRCSSRSSSA